MEHSETHMRIRVPNKLRDRLIKISKKNQRSLNSEVVSRLELSLSKADEFQEMKEVVNMLQKQMIELMRK